MSSDPRPSFVVEGRSRSGRRTGILSCGGCRLRTPIVMPVGPLATAGSLTAGDFAGCGVQALGVDWLRVFLRPGVEAIGALGGLDRFVGWSGPTLAGSAAWAFANAGVRVRADEAIVLSPFDGSAHRLTPETAIEAQVALGLDVVAALDWPDAAARSTREVARLQLSWAERSLTAGEGRGFVLAGVDLGSAELPRELGRLPFDGFVLDGLNPASRTTAAIEGALAVLPDAALRVVDWRGGISGLLEAVAAGVDVVRLPGEADRARAGVVLTREGESSAASDAWLDDSGPLEAGCGCSTCRRFSRAYVRHLYEARELLGPRLVEIHNLTRLAVVVSARES